MSKIDDMYRVCRWCKWYSDGKCFNEAFSQAEAETLGVYQVAEDGRLSEVLEETLGSVKTTEIEREIVSKLEEFKLSNKRIQELILTFRKALEEFLAVDCKEGLDEAISKLYQEDAESRGKSSEGIEISDPRTFYCKEFF